jgi:hypothetical protein
MKWVAKPLYLQGKVSPQINMNMAGSQAGEEKKCLLRAL